MFFDLLFLNFDVFEIWCLSCLMFLTFKFIHVWCWQSHMLYDWLNEERLEHACLSRKCGRACKGAHTLFTGQRGRERKREGEREKEGERERERCRIWLFLFLKGMTGALAHFSYLVFNADLIWYHCGLTYFILICCKYLLFYCEKWAIFKYKLYFQQPYIFKAKLNFSIPTIAYNSQSVLIHSLRMHQFMHFRVFTKLFW